jgi:hypothetical protein
MTTVELSPLTFTNYLLQRAEDTDFGLSSAATLFSVLIEVAVALAGLVILGLRQRAGAIALEPQRVRILDVTLLWRISEQGRDVQRSGTGSCWCPPARATGIHTHRKERHDNRRRTRRGSPTERIHGT